MSKKTVSEQIFENFLSENSISFSPIPTAKTPRPDYSVICGKETILFEIKELSEDADFQSKPLQASTRIVGNHVRSKIVEAGKQIKYGADQGLPSVLLIYNNIDHMHLFGTEDHDFSTAMYGEFSLRVDNATDKLVEAYHGRNQKLRHDANTSFSAIGRLAPVQGTMRVKLFENIFAKVPLSFDKMPACFEIVRVNLEQIRVDK